MHDPSACATSIPFRTAVLVHLDDQHPIFRPSTDIMSSRSQSVRAPSARVHYSVTRGRLSRSRHSFDHTVKHLTSVLDTTPTATLSSNVCNAGCCLELCYTMSWTTKLGSVIFCLLQFPRSISMNPSLYYRRNISLISITAQFLSLKCYPTLKKLSSMDSIRRGVEGIIFFVGQIVSLVADQLLIRRKLSISSSG